MTADTIAPESLTLSAEQVADVISAHYALEIANVSNLHSELSSVHRVELADGRTVAFKAVTSSEGARQLAEWQTSAMEHLNSLGIPAAATLRNVRGDRLSVTQTASGPIIAHVSEWLTGTALESVSMSANLMRTVGETSSSVAVALSDWPRFAGAHGHPWELVRTLSSIRESLEVIHDAAIRELLEAAARRFAEVAEPKLAGLPQTVLHHDLHDSNLLIDVQQQRVSGVLDFGDMVWGPRVAELAVTAGYACRGAEDPAAAYLDVARGWARRLRLQSDEVDVLLASSIGRLAVNLAVWNARQGSDRGEYAQSRSQTTVHGLNALLAVEPKSYAASLRQILC